jgi:hypothetical protein
MAERRGGVIAAFQAGSLTTKQACALLDVSTPQAVHQIRERGKLLGRTVGKATYYPAWQFTDVGLREDLPRIIAAITAFTTDAVAADRILRLPRQEFDGKSIAETLDDAMAEDAWQILRRLGGGF